MHPRVEQMLASRRTALTERETALEKKAHQLLLAAMNRPTVTVRGETEFLLTGLGLMLIRLQKRLLQRLLQRKPRSRKTP